MAEDLILSQQEAIKKLEEIRSEKDQNIAALHKTAQRHSLMATIAENSAQRLDEIDEEFAKATSLNRKDIAFLILAIALQCARQYVLGTFTQRKNHDESDELAHKAQGKLWKDEGEVLSDSARAKKVKEAREAGTRYVATREEIMFSFSVPYDVIKGTKVHSVGGEGIGLSGVNHRYKTLGHDPLLGLVFGTANIMTNTLTNNLGKTFHVEKSQVVSDGNHFITGRMFEHVASRTKETPADLGCCLIKQCLHIGSDMYSKQGIVIPCGVKLDQAVIQRVTEYGLDYGNLSTAGKGATLSVLINLIIGMLHRMTYDESQEFSERLFSVRTRKILLYSNCIASASNLIGSAFGIATGVASGNLEAAKKAANYIDIGGLIVTIQRIFSDTRFIAQVKQEFIANQWADHVQAILAKGGDVYVD